MEPPETPLPDLLRVARRSAGMTQMQLTLAIGLSQPVSLSRYENGHSLPEPERLQRIIEVLGLDADQVWRAWGIAYAERARRTVGS